MRVAITGASGFIGRALVAALVQRGDTVVALGRDPEALPFSKPVLRRRFDPNDARPQPDAFEAVDAVVHLAGETVAGRWTARKKRAIRDSRVLGTRHVVASLAACTSRPATLLCASAVGLYGSRGDEPLEESARAGGGFLAEVCAQWEAAACDAEALGIRVARLRTGVVLGEGGALAAMATPFKLGLGGPFGSGRQFVPWIHIDDLVALYLCALDRDLRGAINAVTPDYATSSRFSQALGMALGRPALLPAPGFALRIALGEFAGTLLASQLVIPARAIDADFSWKYPILENAMLAATRSHSRTVPIAKFESSQVVDATLDEVFAFFSDPRNLQSLTPPALSFAFRRLPRAIERGTLISYKLRLHGFPISWDTLIAQWEPPYRFVDVQLHGPYALWHHEHTFEEVAGGVRIVDRVRYVLPFLPLGALLRSFVKRDVEQIFAFRKIAILSAFGGRTRDAERDDRVVAIR